MNLNKNIKDLIEYPKQGIISKTILKKDDLDIGLFCMASETEMSQHTSTKKAIVNVIEGNGIFNLEGKDIKMIPGTLIFMEKNAVHSLKAIKKTAFLLILMK